ncbi:MAG: type II toxin-antitoxin system Phd/YefM family antitoxin [Methylocystis sp.]|nr:type II toxin-antitoxin system Phd/YefM family antitoxin [Methylocystis sp.]
MGVTTLSSREVNQDIGRAKRASKKGPVVITDRGRPAHVLLTYEDFRRLTDGEPGIRALLDQPGLEEIEFDPPRLGQGLFLPADLA